MVQKLGGTISKGTNTVSNKSEYTAHISEFFLV